MADIALRHIDSRTVTCRSCGAAIRWAVTAAGKKMPIDADVVARHEGNVIFVDNSKSHFATCPNASKHRKKP